MRAGRSRFVHVFRLRDVELVDRLSARIQHAHGRRSRSARSALRVQDGDGTAAAGEDRDDESGKQEAANDGHRSILTKLARSREARAYPTRVTDLDVILRH